jgi:GT2 family glycosyltransferase
VFWTRRQAAQGGGAAWLCAACLLVRRDAFSRFGSLPEDEVVYAEDVAWGTSATARGGRFRLLADVRVPHAKGASGGSAAWHHALGRLLRRRLGPVRGRLAVAIMRTGLATRRALGRTVT